MNWEPLETQGVFGAYLLRVSATRSSHRWRWSVIPLREVERFGRAWFFGSKGPSKADARGHSMTRESAQEDAILMATALTKDDEKRGKAKR
jgi:hypothetical protein